MEAPERLVRTFLPMLCVAAGLGLVLGGCAGAGTGFGVPLMYPAGERAPHWKSGLTAARIGPLTSTRRLEDGSRVFRFQGAGQPALHVWDRISPRYQCPAVTSASGNMRRSTSRTWPSWKA